MQRPLAFPTPSQVWKFRPQGEMRGRWKSSPAGNRTRVTRVTGGDTNLYTTEDPSSRGARRGDSQALSSTLKHSRALSSTLEHFKKYRKREWSSGRMAPCHGVGPGSIPGAQSSFCCPRHPRPAGRCRIFLILRSWKSISPESKIATGGHPYGSRTQNLAHFRPTGLGEPTS